MEFLGNEVSNFRFSTDIEFYSCNIFYWKQRLQEIGISLPDSIINSSHEIRFCKEYLLDKGFNSGPIFPAILYVNRLIGLNNLPVRSLYIFLMMAYVFLGNKISIVKIKYWKYLNSILLLISPILIWLTFFPSTDLLFAVFWFFGLLLFKKYIKRKEFFRGNFKLIEERYNFNKEFIGDISFTLVFSIVLITSILIRPFISICFMLSVFWLIYDLVFIANAFKFKKYNSLIIFKLSSFYNSIVLLFTISILFFIHFTLYENYAIAHDKFHIFFFSFSPPAPLGLKEALNNSLHNLDYLIPRFNENPSLFFKNIINFLFLSINHFIYGVLSISGLQTKFPISTDGNFGLREFAALTKSIYGLFILLPSIYIFFIKIFTLLRNILNKNSNQFLFKSKNYYYFSTRIIACLHILISIIMMPHVRYLVPILPIIIESLVIKKKIIKKI